MTKAVPLLLLVLAGAVFAYIAVRAPEPDYVPPAAGAARVQQAAPAELSGEIPEGMCVRTLDVEGMCCSGCTVKLYAALEALPEVTEAAVSLDQGLARAVVLEDADPAHLVEALCFDKYSARLRP